MGPAGLVVPALPGRPAGPGLPAGLGTTGGAGQLNFPVPPLAADFAAFPAGSAYEHIPRPFLPLAPAVPAVPAGLGTTGGGVNSTFPADLFSAAPAAPPESLVRLGGVRRTVLRVMFLAVW